MTATTTPSATEVFDPDELRAFAARVLESVECSRSDAAEIAEALIEADLRGVHTHGIGFLPRYVRGMQKGDLNAQPELTWEAGKGAVKVLNADNGLGHVAARTGMEEAIRLGQEYGVGIVGVRTSNHFGVAARFASLAAEKNMIGFVTTNGPAVLAPWGGATPTLCNNPIAWAVPAGRHRNIVFDSACSVVARGKILLAAQLGQEIPQGWALDSEGRPTTDARAALDGIVLPMAEYKGFGLAVVNECLAGALTGSLVTLEVSRHTLTQGAVRQTQDSWAIGHFLMAIDVSAFMPVPQFKERIDKVVDDIKASDLAEGFDRIYLPGEIEHELREAREVDGIPLAAGTVAQVREFANEIGIPFP